MSKNVKLRKWKKKAKESQGHQVPLLIVSAVGVSDKAAFVWEPLETRNSSFVAQIALVFSIAAKWKRLYNPGLRARSLLEHLHWHFKGGSGAGQATHPSNKLSIMQCELNNRWPVREMSVQAPFDELWRGETKSTSLSPDSSQYWVLSLIFHGSLQLEPRT